MQRLLQLQRDYKCHKRCAQRLRYASEERCAPEGASLGARLSHAATKLNTRRPAGDMWDVCWLSCSGEDAGGSYRRMRTRQCERCLFRGSQRCSPKRVGEVFLTITPERDQSPYPSARLREWMQTRQLSRRIPAGGSRLLSVTPTWQIYLSKVQKRFNFEMKTACAAYPAGRLLC